MTLTFRIGTRGSPLAMWQAQFVSEELRRAAIDINVELVEIQTTGDQVRDVPLVQLGGEGIFTKAIQQALLDDRVDIAVHSLKDLPTFAVEGLILAAVPARGPMGDALVSREGILFEGLPPEATVATSSLRRRAQLLHRRSDINVVDVRGNVDTRLRKLHEENLDAIILAEAGLKRLGLQEHITEVLDPAWMLPAVGQGALGLECRAGDSATQEVLASIDDPETHAAVLAERALLRNLGGGCQVPIGAHTSFGEGNLVLRGVVLPSDGTKRVADSISGPSDLAEKLGQELAERLLAAGARDLLDIDH